jgi:hypothetical protein
MSAVILRRNLRFIRSQLLPALAIREFKMEAVNVCVRQGYNNSHLLAFLVNHKGSAGRANGVAAVWN